MKKTQKMLKQSSRCEIVKSTCDVCSFYGYGVIYYNKSSKDPFLFECLLCNTANFEKEYEADKKRKSSQAPVKLSPTV